MKTIGELTYALRNQINMDETIKEIAAGSEQHYLAYFMDNLSFEITTFFELLNEDTHKKLMKDNPELDKIINSIVKVWADPEKWLNPSKRSVSIKLSNLYKFRETLSEQVAVLAAYDDKLKMYQYILVRRKDYGDNTEQISDENLAGEILNYIFEYEDSMTINDRVKSVYSQLPVRMSKLKFHEWIENALIGMKGVSVRDLVNYSTYLKETFYPEGVKGYGQVMPAFFKEMANFDELLTDIVAADTVLAFEQKIYAMQQLLDESVGIYTLTASVLNNMIAIISVLTEESLDGCDDVVQSFVRVMKELYSRRKKEEIIDEEMVTVFNDMTVRFNEVMLNKGQYDSLIDEVKQGCVDDILRLGLSERFDRLSSLYVLQSNSLFAPVNLKSDDLEVVDEKKLIEVKNDLLQAIDNAGQANTRIEKRARIANLMGVLNVIHKSAQEIHAYVHTALSACRDEREKQGCCQVLRQLMDEL